MHNNLKSLSMHNILNSSDMRSSLNTIGMHYNLNSIGILKAVDPCQFNTVPDPQIRTTDLQIRIRIRILLFSSSSLTFKMPTKNKFFSKVFLFIIY
jgi:hypothetical protein